MGPREKPTIVFAVVLLNGHLVKLLLTMSTYTHLFVLLSTWVKEFPFCDRQWSMQRLITGQNVEKN